MLRLCQCLRQITDASQHTGDGVKAVLMHHMGISTQAARNADHRLAMALGHRGHAVRCLAKDGLVIDAAFAGNDQIGVPHRLIQAHGLGDDLAARAQLAFEKSHHGRTHAACGTGASHGIHLQAQIALNDGGKVLERRIQLLHHFRRRTFLRAEDG